jgi:hypothetical protein
MRNLILLLLCLLFQSLSAQQWERLGLNGGTFDGMVQNPYNEKELLAYARWYRLYLSHDGGLTWKVIDNQDYPFDLNFIDITFDSQSRIYVLTTGGLWRSADQGQTWSFYDPPTESHNYLDGKVRISEEGTILISNFGSRAIWI